MSRGTDGSEHGADPGKPRKPSAGRKGRQRQPATKDGTAKAQAKAAPKAAQKAAGQKQQNKRRRWLRQVNEFSAGGLVVDLAGDVPKGALIGRVDRHGRLLWSLPKGHIEHGETPEQAAVREVAEETGIEGVILGRLGTIDFWFVAEGRRIHKTVQHFLMRAVGGELSDADVEVSEVAWVPLPEIPAQLAYPDERNLVDAADRLLAETA